MALIERYGYQVITNVIQSDSAQPLKYVDLGGSYGQIVETTKFYQLQTRKIVISSALRDTRQLAFRDEGTGGQDHRQWEWELHLSPFEVAGSEIKLVVCGATKVRHREEIKVQIQGEDQGETNIKVEIG